MSNLPKARDKNVKSPLPKKNRDGNGHGNGGNGGNYGAYGGYGGVNRKKARRMVNDELKDVMQMLRRELRRGRRDMRHDVRDVKQEYRHDRADINHIYGESQEFMNQQNAAINANFANASTQQAAAQQALMSQLSGNGAANIGAADSELARLGMDPSQFNGAGLADQNYALQAAQITGANNDANLAAMASNSKSIGDLLLSMNASSKTSSLDNVRRNKQDQMEGIRDTFRDFRGDIRDQMVDTKGQRGAMVRSLLEQLRQSGWGQYMDQQGLNLQRRSLNHNIAMDNAAQAQQAAYAAAMAGGLGSYYGSMGQPQAPTYGQSGQPGNNGYRRRRRQQTSLPQGTSTDHPYLP